MSLSITRSALAGMIALAVAMGIGRFAFTPILPEMQRTGLTLAAAGWLASANYFGYLVGALLAGRLPGGAVAIRIGLLAVGLGTLAMGFTGSLVAWLVLRFAAGVASACVLVLASTWGLERFQAARSTRARSFGGALLFAGVGAGITFAGIACQGLARARTSPDVQWITLGVAALVATAVVWRAFGETAAHAAPVSETARWDARRLGLVACYGAFGFGYIIPATFISAMARSLDADGASPLGGWVWVLFGMAAVASTFTAAALRRRFADRSIWAASHLVMAAGVVAPLAIPGLAGYLAAALLVGGTFMVATMAGIQEARRVAGAHARALIAAMTTAFAIGQIAGPLAVAALQASTAHYDVPLMLAAALLVASAAALYLIAPEESR